MTPQKKTHRYERQQDKYPLLYAWGDEQHRFLTIEETIAADFPTRIRSVWVYLVKRAKKFEKQIKATDRSVCDIEDIMSEIWLALSEKNDKWDPAKGPYLAFATMVTRSALSRLRARVKLVRVPCTAVERLTEYQAAVEVGELTDRKAKTLRYMENAFDDHESLPTDERGAEDAMPDAADIDWTHVSSWHLDPREAEVLGSHYGVFGVPKRTREETAELLGVRPANVDAMRINATKKLKSVLRRA